MCVCHINMDKSKHKAMDSQGKSLKAFSMTQSVCACGRARAPSPMTITQLDNTQFKYLSIPNINVNA